MCVEAPFLVRTSLSCSSLLIPWMDISFLQHISHKADTLMRNWWSRVSLLVLIVLWSYSLSVSAVTEIVWICSMSVIKFAMKDVVLHLSVSAKVSADRVDLVTGLSLVEFQTTGAELENLSHKNCMYPPWLPPSGKLLKLALEYSNNCRDSKFLTGMVMWLDIDLINLMTLLIVNISAIVEFLTLVLVSVDQFMFDSAIMKIE